MFARVAVGRGGLLPRARTLRRNPARRPLRLLPADVFAPVLHSLGSSRETLLQSSYCLSCQSCSRLYRNMPVTVPVCSAVEVCSPAVKVRVKAGSSRRKTRINQYMCATRHIFSAFHVMQASDNPRPVVGVTLRLQATKCTKTNKQTYLTCHRHPSTPLSGGSWWMSFGGVHGCVCWLVVWELGGAPIGPPPLRDRQMLCLCFTLLTNVWVI